MFMPPFLKSSWYYFDQIMGGSIRTFGFACQGNIDRKICGVVSMFVVGRAVVFAPDPEARCGDEANQRIITGMAQDDDEGLTGSPDLVDARLDERLSYALPLQVGQDGDGRKAHAVR
jgi:hypothetical protein